MQPRSPVSFTSTAVGRKAFRYAAPSPVSHVLHLATPAPLTRFSKLARYKSCNNNNVVMFYVV